MMRPLAETAPSSDPLERRAKALARSGPSVSPICISYPENGMPSPVVPHTRSRRFSAVKVVSTSSRPRPSTTPTGPSSPTGSRIVRPSIW